MSVYVRVYKGVSIVLLLVSLTGCDLFQIPVPPPPPEVPAPPPEEPPAPRSRMVGQQVIVSGTKVNSGDHLADIEVWMDTGPTHPRIVLRAAVDLEFFEVNLALPACYVFPRPNGEIPSWRSGRLLAGEVVEIPSHWEKIGEACEDDFATVLWNLASRHQGSKSKMSILWQWPEM